MGFLFLARLLIIEKVDKCMKMFFHKRHFYTSNINFSQLIIIAHLFLSNKNEINGTIIFYDEILL